MDTTVKKRLITREEYYRMGETGVIQPHEKVELINGEIFTMSPIGVTHAAVVDNLVLVMIRKFGDSSIVRSQNPVCIDQWNEPEPDFALLKFRQDSYYEAHPDPSDVLLIIEVSDTSYEFDRTIKLSLYASSGIPVYWIIDLRHNRIEVYEDPQSDGYQNQSLYVSGDRISFQGHSFEVNEMLLIKQ